MICDCVNKEHLQPLSRMLARGSLEIWMRSFSAGHPLGAANNICVRRALKCKDVLGRKRWGTGRANSLHSQWVLKCGFNIPPLVRLFQGVSAAQDALGWF